MMIGETIVSTRWIFVGKAMSLLFNMVSRLVLAFLPRSKGLLISCLQSPSAVILETKKIKSDTDSIVSQSTCHEVMGPDAMNFVFFLSVEFQGKLFTLLFHFHQAVLQFLLAFCHKGGVICISEVTDISPSNLDSQLVLHQDWHFI